MIDLSPGHGNEAELKYEAVQDEIRRKLEEAKRKSAPSYAAAIPNIAHVYNNHPYKSDPGFYNFVRNSQQNNLPQIQPPKFNQGTREDTIKAFLQKNTDYEVFNKRFPILAHSTIATISYENQISKNVKTPWDIYMPYYNGNEIIAIQKSTGGRKRSQKRKRNKKSKLKLKSRRR